MIIARPINQNECDILIGHETKTLIIKDLSDEIVKLIEPISGFWSYDSLESIDYDKYTPHGWNAYLGDNFIGSSEI